MFLEVRAEKNLPYRRCGWLAWFDFSAGCAATACGMGAAILGVGWFVKGSSAELGVPAPAAYFYAGRGELGRKEVRYGPAASCVLGSTNVLRSSVMYCMCDTAVGGEQNDVAQSPVRRPERQACCRR